ncbi:hypothetical protein F8M41_001520 [Gigaspora margarita]|uniref:Uncharacterized protein n=1 Tax=Gigaspora margarita TaxID=4874 RepID=A0A8H3XFT3_GIGMA|nr:hypothetical protein F8M41_001520 [Gigaspora margarita]
MLMGDMPELMENILNNLNREFNSLYSCALRCPKASYKILTFTIIKLLIKKFIESGATLQELYLDFFVLDEIQPEICCSLEQNMQFLSRLQNLSINSISFKSNFNIESLATLLKILGNGTTKLNNLNITVPDYYDPQLFQSLICIINSQKQLKQFYMIDTYGFSENLPSIISALKSQKQSLQEVRIIGCKFIDVFKVLTNFENLETFRVRNCEFSNNKELLKILDKNFYKIKTFEVVTDMEFDTLIIVQCIKMFGSLLQRLKLEAKCEDIVEKSLLLETIKSFCPNITYLYIMDNGLSDQFQELIGNLQKLQFLTLYSLDAALEIIENEPRRLMTQFARILPSTLQYLDIRNSHLNSYIGILINHCNAPLKKLLISYLYDEKNAKALIEFSIRKRTLNYVGVYDMYSYNNFKKEMEGYITLVLYENAVVDL